MHRNWVGILTVALTLASVAACASNDAGPVPAAPVATGPETPTLADGDGSATEAPPLADGHYATYLHGVDVDARRITVDVIQFLSGKEAVEAYQSENPNDSGGPPNDYWIVNDSVESETMPVAPDVTVELVRLQEDGDADLDPGTWTELPAYLTDYTPDDGRLSYNPYWLTVTGGVVTGIEEQYVP